MNTTSDTAMVELLFQWVQERDKAAFKLEYGYGIVEEPWITLFVNHESIFEGTFSEFKKWATK